MTGGGEEKLPRIRTSTSPTFHVSPDPVGSILLLPGAYGTKTGDGNGLPKLHKPADLTLAKRGLMISRGSKYVS